MCGGRREGPSDSRHARCRQLGSRAPPWRIWGSLNGAPDPPFWPVPPARPINRAHPFLLSSSPQSSVACFVSRQSALPVGTPRALHHSDKEPHRQRAVGSSAAAEQLRMPPAAACQPASLPLPAIRLLQSCSPAVCAACLPPPFPSPRLPTSPNKPRGRPRNARMRGIYAAERPEDLRRAERLPPPSLPATYTRSSSRRRHAYYSHRFPTSAGLEFPACSSSPR